MSKDRTSEEEELNSRYQDSLIRFHENPSETTRLETERFNKKL